MYKHTTDAHHTDEYVANRYASTQARNPFTLPPIHSSLSNNEHCNRLKQFSSNASSFLIGDDIQ